LPSVALKRPMSSYVLDASALLALLQQETGAGAVAAALHDASVSTVNWSEVLQKSLAQGIDTADMQTDFEALGVQFVPFSSLQSELAAQLWPNTKSLGIALAFDLQAIALTADQVWANLNVGVNVQLIR
jgi:ribonuclease VapC